MRTLVIFLLLTGTVYAEDVVRYSGTTYQGCISIGNTGTFLNDPNDLTTVKLGYIHIPQTCRNLLPGVPEQYRKVVDTDADLVLDSVVEMSQAEKDAVDAPLLAAQAKQQAFTDEVAANDLCSAELSDVAARLDAEKATIDAAITAASNVATLKTAVAGMNARYAAVLKKLGRCVRARAR